MHKNKGLYCPETDKCEICHEALERYLRKIILIPLYGITQECTVQDSALQLWKQFEARTILKYSSTFLQLLQIQSSVLNNSDWGSMLATICGDKSSAECHLCPMKRPYRICATPQCWQSVLLFIKSCPCMRIYIRVADVGQCSTSRSYTYLSH